jgi:hypothetical protein
MSEEAQNNDQQSAETDWRASMPETVRSWDEAKNAQTPEDFWNQIANHRSLVGRSVQIPTGDASEEDREKFFGRMKQHFPDITKAPNYDDPETLREVRRRMGMPETPDKYIQPSFEVPEGAKVDEAKLSRLSTLAHEAGLTQSQYEKLIGTTMGEGLQTAAEQTRLFKEELSSLKKEWGMAFEEKSAAAEKIRQEYFDFIPPEAMNAASRRAMEKIAKQFGAEGHSLTDTADKVRPQSLTPSEARQRAAEIMGDKNGPYWDIRNPMHKHTKEKYRKLLEIANS